MGKPIKCKLIFHGRRREIDMGEFPSKAEAKKYANECWSAPYSIRPLPKQTTDEKETKALGWFGVLTNMQKNKYAEQYFSKKHFNLKTSEIITIWENKASGVWV